jgi:hypothetical protein
MRRSGSTVSPYSRCHTYRGVAARNRQVLAALVMAAAICGMHYTGMAAAAFSADSVCLSAGQLRGDSVGVLVTVTATMLLSLAMFTSLLDARMQGKTERLAVSLKAANAELQEIAFRDALTGLPNRCCSASAGLGRGTLPA